MFPDACHKSVTIATSLEQPSQYQYNIIKPTPALYLIFAKRLVDISPGTPVKQRKRA